MKKLLFGVIMALVAIGAYCGCNQHRDVYDVDDEEGNICPRCKSDSTATIMYGLLTNEERANMDSFQNVLREQKKVIGGCCVGPERFYCYNCGNRW